MNKLYRIKVSITHFEREGWETEVYVRAYQAVEKKKIVVVNEIREGRVETGAYATTHLKPKDIDAPFVNVYKDYIVAGVWCREEQIEDYISVLKQNVKEAICRIRSFWEDGFHSFTEQMNEVEVKYMENR